MNTMHRRLESSARACARQGLRIEETSDLWWKNAIFYCLDIETYLDSNGDGIGDMSGLIERIDYLARLGVTCIWLMPFYESPNRDHGYDVTDHYSVDPALGDPGDFVELVRTARSRGIRVLCDLVLNHTSKDHPWFQNARRSEDSPFRDYYVWRSEPPEIQHKPLVFPGQVDTQWTYDEEAKAYYLHHFYSHQPDLNPSHPAVLEELSELVTFWLQQGCSGFRVDAVPYLLVLCELEGEPHEAPHDVLRTLRAVASRRLGEVVLLGEVNEPPDAAARFFGDSGDELNMALNFWLNQRLFLALARKSALPLRQGLQQTPTIPATCQWANFVRNHDELTLDQLSEEERDEVFREFAPDESMRVFGRGIRRRLPTMLGRDRRRIELTYSLLFSLPGAPVLYYGEEIGMGENLELFGRTAVRAPMQWSSGENGGFSSAPPDKLRRALPEGEDGPDRLNVAAQRRDPGSLLSWMERAIWRRRECPEIGMGVFSLLDVALDEVLACRYDWCESTVIVVHNLGGDELEVPLPFDAAAERAELVEVFSDRGYPSPGPGAADIALGSFGYRWFRVRRGGQPLPV